MFDQDELRRGSGTGLDRARKVLNKEWSNVTDLFEMTINSGDFKSCPSPRDWQQVFDGIPGVFAKPPKLGQLENIPADYFQKILSKNLSPAPLWPPPSLSDIPEFHLELPLELSKVVSNVVTSPPNPWN